MLIECIFKLVPFRFHPFLLMENFSVHIVQFSNKYAMKTIGVHISSKTVLIIPFSKQSLLLIAVKKAPIVTLNAIVINSQVRKECEAFSNVSVFGVHTESGSFSKRIFFRFLSYH